MELYLKLSEKNTYTYVHTHMLEKTQKYKENYLKSYHINTITICFSF